MANSDWQLWGAGVCRRFQANYESSSRRFLSYTVTPNEITGQLFCLANCSPEGYMCNYTNHVGEYFSSRWAPPPHGA